jgi:hypothetical protein
VAVILAVIGAVLVSVGAGLWNLPAGLVTAGVQCLAAAYVTTYLKARAR